ncbi:hypothetical protein NQ318_015559 [Aromia moschata]|uniref:Uncharacterized protein n=1 Tax=Aromia moschata TaxID=1265417 RepID=A0AAV8XJZ4_9CUCU|nr:hypothetical protein NQ318_015559 [Aromia moschata]
MLKGVQSKYSCHMTGKNVSCTEVEKNTLYKNISVTLSNADSNAVEELEVTNSSIIILEEGTFTNFKSLRTLYLRNTTTRYLAEGVFANLLSLTTIGITDNYLETLSSDAFGPNNSVQFLDVSHNLLSDLSDFDVGWFPSLVVLNVSHNRLEHLPAGVLDRLAEVNDFYAIVDNNPWNCSHPAWAERLTETSVAAFCGDHVYDSSEAQSKMRALEESPLNGTEADEEAAGCFWRCAFLTCVWWIIGAVWVGVILGNVCKLKRLLFTQPRTYVDKNTQCGTYAVRFSAI